MNFEHILTSGGSFVAANILVMMTAPLPGRDEDFNAWYSHTHLPEVVALEGFTGAQRFALDRKFRADGPELRPYLALYDIAEGQLDTAQAALGAAGAAGNLTGTDATDGPATLGLWGEGITERVWADHIAPGSVQHGHLLMMITNPVEGREDEFNDWYDNRHVPDVVNNPGFQWAQRYKVKSTFSGEPSSHSYFAIYGIEQGALDSTVNALYEQLAANEAARAAGEAEPMFISTSLDRNIPGAFFNVI